MKYSQESVRDGKEIDQKNIGQPEISYFSKRCGMVPRRFFYFFFRSHYRSHLTPSTNSSVAVDRLSALSMITAVKAPLQERCETRSATVRLSALRHGTHGGVMVFSHDFSFHIRVERYPDSTRIMSGTRCNRSVVSELGSP